MFLLCDTNMSIMTFTICFCHWHMIVTSGLPFELIGLQQNQLMKRSDKSKHVGLFIRTNLTRCFSRRQFVVSIAIIILS